MPPMKRSVLGMIMAGGRGSRLFPLTDQRAKPAVPFGGKFRIIDFVLSNFTNSGIFSLYVLTQFKSQSLTEHIQEAWNISGKFRSQFVHPVPAQMQAGEFWYRGTADAIFQNLNLVREANPDVVCIFGGDHIYRMDISQMIGFHGKRGSDLTVAAIVVPKEEATQFGVIQVDEDWRIIGFEEKPQEPKTMPTDPTKCLVSMGNYVFERETLVNLLERDAANPESDHDFGKNIIPEAIQSLKVYCYDFTQNDVPGEEGPNTYWRDVGTIDSYYEASMDLRMPLPQFNLYNNSWPIRSLPAEGPPAKFVHYQSNRKGRALDSLVCEGSIISGARIKNCIIGRNVKVHSFCEITDSIIFDGVEIGRDSKVHKAIIDKNNIIPEGSRIGLGTEQSGPQHYVTPSGIVVVPKKPRFGATLGTLNF